MRAALAIIFLFIAVNTAQPADLISMDAKDWRQLKDRHFLIVFPQGEDDAMPRAILRRAEEYYSRITDRIGYAQWRNSWTWEDPVRIVYFPDQQSYVQHTGQPAWSKGFSISHLKEVDVRMIISYKGQENFLETVLPHEIGHLVLHDFLGGKKPPMWVDEGVAQLEEATPTQESEAQRRTIMARLSGMGKLIPVTGLDAFAASPTKTSLDVEIFYAESLYITDFLVKTYGKGCFAEFCRKLRDGAAVDDALRSAYYPSIASMADLGSKWSAYMEQFAH